MTSTIKNTCFDCADPYPLAEFWSQVLGIPDGTGWAVLADPEGNELCVLRSAAERAATG